MAGEPFNNYKFELTVSSIQLADARILNRVIVAVIEAFSATAGGGFRQVIDDNEFIEIEDPAQVAHDMYVKALRAKKQSVLEEAEAGMSSNETILWLRGYAQAIDYAINLIEGRVYDGQA